MTDTYFGTSNVKLTEENCHLFELICDLKQVRDVGKRCPSDTYEASDYYRIPTDSGGIQSPHYFLKNDAKPSVRIQLKSVRDEIQTLESKLGSLRAREKYLLSKLEETQSEKGDTKNDTIRLASERRSCALSG